MGDSIIQSGVGPNNRTYAW